MTKNPSTNYDGCAHLLPELFMVDLPKRFILYTEGVESDVLQDGKGRI